MAITVTGYGQGFLAALKAGIDFDGATYKFSKHTATYAPDRDAHDFQNDLTNVLSTANGYAEKTLTLASLSYDAASDQVRWDFDDISYTYTADQTWRYGVVWIDTAGASTTDPLMFLMDWGSSQTVQGVYNLTFDTAGLFAIDFT